MRRIVVLCVLAALALFVVGCSGPAAPDPTEVARQVEQAVQATLAAQPSPAPIRSISTAAITMPAATIVLASTSAPIAAPTMTQEPTALPTPTAAHTATPRPSATQAPTGTPTPIPTATATPEPAVVAAKAVNLRGGPGTSYPVVGQLAAGERISIQGRSEDGTWFEVCCVNERSAWVAGSVVTTEGAIEGVQVAANIPTPPLTPTPAPTAPPARPPAGLHDRQTIGTWEIQAERVQNEKAVYQYGSSKIAMGRYAIVFVLAKNLASGTQDMAASLAPALRDDKGRIYDFSDPLTTERMAMLYACWEFSVGKTVFGDINPGVETPLLMLWDVNADVQSLTLILTDGRNRAEWDLGDFANIPPYQP